MSKINELRRKATEAARKRDWPKAIKLYERVCEIDSNNASFRNELGDIHLKTGDVLQALESFTKAADQYRAVGLHNNAVAVLKKILRHDKDHLDALWGLGELKEVQGLESDAQLHYVDFLSKSEVVTGSSRQKFVNRCLLLLEKFGDDLQMLSRIEMIFEAWELSEDHARVIIQKARMAFEEGQTDLVEKYVGHAREVYDDLDTLDDYIELCQLQAGTGDAPSAAVEPSVSGPAPAAPPTAARSPVRERGDIDVDKPQTELRGGEAMRTGEIDLGFDIEVGGSMATGIPEPNTIQIDLPSQGIQPPSKPTKPDVARSNTAEPVAEPKRPATPPAAPAEAAAPQRPDPTPAGSVNLLDELLSDSGSFDFRAGESEQVDAIRSNLGDQLASQLADDDYAGHYELGLVYMDMGLYDQAADAFAKSSGGSEHRLKGLEMKGSCLRLAGRKDAALAVFLEGLSDMTEPDSHHLGLLYEAGVCFEEMGQSEDARRAYEQVVAVDGAFKDVARRLEHLGATTG